MNEGFTLACNGNLTLAVRVLQRGIVRITCSGHDTPDPSLLERYGIIDEPAADTTARRDGNTITFGNHELVFGADGQWALRKGGETVAETAAGHLAASAPTEKKNAGYRVCMKVHEGEKLVGLGDQQRQQILLNGLSGELWIKNPVRHHPVPFYMSSRGYGIFFNTTRRLQYNVAKSSEREAVFAVAKQFLDIYLITGRDYTELIDRFTLLTGRPNLPPMKAFGMWLILYYWSTANDVQMIASGLRERKIPCDNLSLEPGWMEKNYDMSVDKDWSEHRFTACQPSCWRGAAQHMIETLRKQGFNLGLWLCCRWDFTYEEERRAVGHRPPRPRDSLLQIEGVDYEFIDEHMTNASYLDVHTKRDEPWFAHLKKFADDGVRYFKLDGCAMLSEFPDRLYANGKTDEEMHNLAFLLEAKETFGDYQEYTKKRAYGIFAGGWAGLQRYAGTWTGDTGGGKQPMLGLLQNAMVGHAFCTCDVENDNLQGLHMGFLLPWTVVDCWAACHYPGFISDEMNELNREYANLRMTLVEFFYSLARRASCTGMGIIRPLCLVYPDQDWAYTEDMMFMIGDSLLADVFSGEAVRLPKGRWCDFWTGEVHSGTGEVLQIPVPKRRGGHLFVREGTLIPTVPVRQYVDPKEIREIEWLVFPREDGTACDFDLYLDDGDSLKYRDGDYAVQKVGFSRGALVFGEIKGGNPEYLKKVHHTFRIMGA